MSLIRKYSRRDQAQTLVIEVDDKNKWKTIIQNVSLHEIKNKISKILQNYVQ